jgi:hypothetical protein
VEAQLELKELKVLLEHKELQDLQALLMLD